MWHVAGTPGTPAACSPRSRSRRRSVSPSDCYRGTSLRTAQIGRRTEGAERLVLKGWRDHWHIHENYSSGVFVALVTRMSEPGVPSAEATEKLLVAMASV